MKTGQKQLNVECPADFHRLVKTSAAAAGTSIEEIILSMGRYFWGYDDTEDRNRQQAASITIKALTKGKRPFNDGAAGQSN